MPHIVAATDFSTRSQRALRRAGLFARQSGAELTLVHVVDDDQPKAMMDRECRDARKFLDEQIASLAELRDVRCRAVVPTGEAFDSILKTAKSVSASLIVMGSHRKQVLRDVFVGTTIERVMRVGPYPVLMVNKEAEHAYRQVLAAVDMSEPSAHAIKTAESLRLLDDARVTVVHAFTISNKGELFVADASRELVDKYIAEGRRQAAAELSTFFAAHGTNAQRWPVRIEEGGAYDVISRVAKEMAPDLVVIGTRGRSGFAKALLGSVAEEVLYSLDVDILAVPPAG